MSPDPGCSECDGTGFEWLLSFRAPCEVCLMIDDADDEKTPAQTPDAKKSSGGWRFRFNEPDAVCGRNECLHRRDEHETGTLRCMLCDCERFVVGGPDFNSLHDTDPAPSR